jgi:hypothetical protein
VAASQVVNCSKFEAHAGMGRRRAPYDNIYTLDAAGDPMDALKTLAARIPGSVSESALPAIRRASSRGGSVSGGLHRPRIAPTLRRRAIFVGDVAEKPLEVHLPGLPDSEDESEEGAAVVLLMLVGELRIGCQ